ncbi:hypothetical protein BH20ACT9_BH20ACT9_21630 [soil metagenome]
MIDLSREPLVVVGPTRRRVFDLCPRRFRNEHLLGVPSDAAEPAPASLGRLVHEELRARHDDPDRHDDARMVTGEGVRAADPVADAAVRAHLRLCPRGRARYLGGEVALSWAPARERLLLSGRVDALWEHPDGTVEIRDYKTGMVPTELRADFAAGVYALLVAALQPRPPRIVVSYERLVGEPAVVSVAVDRELLAAALDAVRGFAARLRAERSFAATPSPPVCRMCPYTRTCPDSLAS